jgi:hypothetical protein
MIEPYIGFFGLIFIFLVFYFGFKKTPEQRSFEERSKKNN